MTAVLATAAAIHDPAARQLHRGDLLGRGSFGRQACGADLQQPPRLVHLLAGEAVQLGEEPERRAPDRDRKRGPGRR